MIDTVKINQDPTLKLFRELLAIGSPAGQEEEMAQFVVGKIKDYGLSPKKDGAGNLWVDFAAPDPVCHLALAAHMDEIGAVVTSFAEDGDLVAGPSGGLLPHKLGEGPVEVRGDHDRITGILSYGSTHGGVSEGKASLADWSQVRVLTGLSVTQLREAGVRPGSSILPVKERRGPVLFGDPNQPLLSAWTFDDRMGMVALIQLLEHLSQTGWDFPYRLSIVFTVHEEGGCHGAKVWAQREKPDVFVAVDGCPITTGSPVCMDERPCAWSQDRWGHFDQALLGVFREAAEQAGTTLQTVVLPVAYSDASSVYNVGAVPRAATFGHPRKNSHGFEVADLRVFQNVFLTLKQFLPLFAEEGPRSRVREV